MLNARASIHHFHKLSLPDPPSPTQANAVGRVVRGLERTVKHAEKQKLGLMKQNLHHFLNYLLPNGIEEASLRELRDTSIFSLMFFAAARFDDIKDMKIGHLRFKEDHLKCGFLRLKNQKANSDVSIVCVAEHELDPLSTVKLIKRLVIVRVTVNGAQEDDVLFPALEGRLWRRGLSPTARSPGSSSPCSWGWVGRCRRPGALGSTPSGSGPLLPV